MKQATPRDFGRVYSITSNRIIANRLLSTAADLFCQCLENEYIDSNESSIDAHVPSIAEGFSTFFNLLKDHEESVQLNENYLFHILVIEEFRDIFFIKIYDSKQKWSKRITVLQATISQFDASFEEYTNGAQRAAIVALALAYAKYNKVASWTSQTLDDLIRGGNLLYKVSHQATKLPTKSRYLTLDEVRSEFNFNGVNYRIMAGVILEHYSYFCFGFKAMKTAIVKFFQSSSRGALCSRLYYIAIFKIPEGSKDWFYIFDSHQRDSNGLYTPARSATGVLIKLDCIDTMTEMIMRNISSIPSAMTSAELKKEKFRDKSLSAIIPLDVTTQRRSSPNTLFLTQGI